MISPPLPDISELTRAELFRALTEARAQLETLGATSFDYYFKTDQIAALEERIRQIDRQNLLVQSKGARQVASTAPDPWTGFGANGVVSPDVLRRLCLLADVLTPAIVTGYGYTLDHEHPDGTCYLSATLSDGTYSLVRLRKGERPIITHGVL